MSWSCSFVGLFLIFIRVFFFIRSFVIGKYVPEFFFFLYGFTFIRITDAGFKRVPEWKKETKMVDKVELFLLSSLDPHRVNLNTFQLSMKKKSINFHLDVFMFEWPTESATLFWFFAPHSTRVWFGLVWLQKFSSSTFTW